jgi:hypothetical protein
MDEKEIKIEFEKEEKLPEEELLKEEKKQVLKQMEQKEKEEKEQIEQKEQVEEKEEIPAEGRLAEILAMVWNSIAVNKGYEPLNEQEITFLKQHSVRFEEKYMSKIAIVQYPEVEFGLALTFTLLPKWIKKQREQVKK